MTTTNSLINETIRITRMAGRSIMNYYLEAFSVSDKTPDNPVTDADLAADALLRQQLGALLPEAGWLSEETADSPDRLEKRTVWVVDPLDGTKEFVKGIPEFSVSVALVENGRPRLAVVYNPPTQELFHAIRGMGAYLNGVPISASQTADLAQAEVDASRSERLRGEFAPFEKRVKLQTMGSIAYKLARVAAGHADATWSRGPKSEWDVCAGDLLIEEAGGRCVDLDGKQLAFNKSYPKINGIIATNSQLYEPVMRMLAPHRASARTD